MSTKKKNAVSLVDVALEYSRRGRRILPLPPLSKSPRAKSHGVTDATNDELQIKSWWTQNPQYGIGLATGSGLIVLDIDGQRGKASLSKLVGMLEALPPTVEVHTPGKGGGWHLYYKTGGRVLPSRNEIADCIDVRGEGGYVVAPPTLHPSGGVYQFAKGKSFDDIEIAELPPKWAIFLGLGNQSVTAGYYPQSFKGGDGTATINLPAGEREVNISITVR
jgi:hypothetical protein